MWRKRHTPTVEGRGHEGSNPSTRNISAARASLEGAPDCKPGVEMQQGSIPWSGTNLGVGQRLATCLGSRPTQVRILSPRPRGCRPAAGSGAAIARTRVRFPSASPIQAPPKLMGTSNRPLTGGQRVRGSLGGTNHCGSSGGPWAHNPKVEAGFNSLTRNQSPKLSHATQSLEPSITHAPVRYPVSRPLSESGVSVRSTRTWGTNCTAHPVPFSVGLWGDREGYDQPSPKRSR